MGKLSGKKVLITGAAGFIGGHLTRRLVAEGANVSVFVRVRFDARTLSDVQDRISVHEVDIGEADAVNAAMASIRPEVVFHLAAIGMSEPCVTSQAAMRVNVQGTQHLLEAACQVGLERFVHTGTAYEYGCAVNGKRLGQQDLDPLNIYAASKVSASEWVQRYVHTRDLSAVILRLFAVYGPNQSPRSLVPSAVLAALEGRDYPMTPGEQVRDYIFVSDVVQGYLRAATAEQVQGAAIDLATGQACPVRDIVQRLFELVGTQARPLPGALPYRPGEMMKQVTDTRLARELLGWQATTSLDDGLRQTIGWYRQQSAIGHWPFAVSHWPSANYA